MPVNLDEMKQHLKVDNDVDDSLIEELLDAATDYCQKETGRIFVSATQIDYFQGLCSVMDLEWSAPVSITSITYLDNDGVRQTANPLLYELDDVSEPGRVILAYAQSWPAFRTWPKSIEVTYIAGYGVAAEVPAGVKRTIKILVAHWYEHRMAVQEERLANVPIGLDNMLWKYKVTQA